MSGARAFRFVVSPAQAGERVDRVCAQQLGPEGVSRSQLARLCDAGDVLLAGRATKPSSRVRAGDTLEVRVPPPEPVTAQPEDIPLRVVYEDPALMVVDKPAGLVVHPARGHASGTLVNAVLHHAELEDDDDPLRPGIVHRIDKDTSGLLVIAKTAAAREGLIAQFRVHSIAREYVALTLGVPPERATYDTLHGRHPTDRQRFTTKVREGRRAVTRARVEEVLARGAAARVACELETGRTHQIRVHLAEAGYPLLGDALYGRRAADVHVQKIAQALGRQALHARVLGFVHPASGQAMRFESELPDDLARALAALRALGGA